MISIVDNRVKKVCNNSPVSTRSGAFGNMRMSYGMIRVGGTSPKYRDGIKASKPAAGDISDVERRV